MDWPKGLQTDSNWRWLRDLHWGLPTDWCLDSRKGWRWDWPKDSRTD